jgi:hypothetical protein
LEESELVSTARIELLKNEGNVILAIIVSSIKTMRAKNPKSQIQQSFKGLFLLFQPWFSTFF